MTVTFWCSHRPSPHAPTEFAFERSWQSISTDDIFDYHSLAHKTQSQKINQQQNNIYLYEQQQWPTQTLAAKISSVTAD
jgi:hypothetical protein